MNAESLMILIKIAGGIFVVWVLYEFFIAYVLEKGDEVPLEEEFNHLGVTAEKAAATLTRFGEALNATSALDVEEVDERPDRYCISTPDGNCISTDPRCMHNRKPTTDLGAAVKKARGGDAPVEKKGFA